MKRLPARPLAAVAVGLLVAATVQARPVHYQCVGYQPLDAEFTPRTARIHFQGKDVMLQRVRDGREARYVGSRSLGWTVTLKQSAMTLQQGDKTLECKLITDALAQFAASAPSSPSR